MIPACCNFSKWLLAVDGVTPASSASSVAVSGRPSIKAFSILPRAGSPIADATTVRSGRGVMVRSLSGSPLVLTVLAHPCLGYSPTTAGIVHHKDQLMIMVAVGHFNVHSRFGHLASNLAKLTRLPLIQSLRHDLPLLQDAYPRGLERLTSPRALREKKFPTPHALYPNGPPPLIAPP